MKKLFASVSYSFNNFYDSLNTQGQMIFSVIVFLIILLCVLLLVTYIVQLLQDRKKINKIARKKVKTVDISIKNNDDNHEIKNEEKAKEVVNQIAEEEREPLYTKETTEVEDIAKRVEEALREEAPINLTDFEEDQERTAIISIDELIARAKELEIVEDEERGVNYLEKYNLEPAEVENVVNSTMKSEPPKEVKAFKVSQVISPIYGIKKDIVENKNN